MTIKNTKMGGEDFTYGESVYPNDMNDIFNKNFQSVNLSAVATGLNSIRQMINIDDKTGKGGIDGFTEAYIDRNGRKNTIVTGSTTSFYNIASTSYLSYIYTEGTLHDPEIFTNAANAFDFSTSTFADYVQDGTGTLDSNLGRTFSATTIGIITIKAHLVSDYSALNPFSIRLESYNGSSWDEEAILINGTLADTQLEYDSTYELNKSVQGIRIRFYCSTVPGSAELTAKLFILTIGKVGTSEIYNNITSNVLPSNMTNIIGVPFYNDYNSDVSVTQYKVYNSTTDSGWLDSNELQTVSFTQPPRKLNIKLGTATAFSSSNGIKGFYIYGK